MDCIQPDPGGQAPPNVAAANKQLLDDLSTRFGGDEIRLNRDGVETPDGLVPWHAPEAAENGFGSRTAPRDCVPGTESAERRKPNLWSLGEIFDLPELEVSWLVEGLLPFDRLWMIVALPKVGKSTLMRCLAATVATGGEFLGRKVEQGNVLHVCIDEPIGTMREHYREIGAPRDSIFVTDLRDEEGRKIAKDDRLRWVAEYARAVHAKFVLIDTLQKMLEITDGNDPGIVDHAMTKLLDMSRSLKGTHVMCVHHSRKAGGKHGLEASGAKEYVSNVDGWLSVARDDDTRTVYGEGRDNARLPTTVLSYTDGVYRGQSQEDVNKQELVSEVWEFVVDAGEPVSVPTIRAGVKARRGRVLDALGDLKRTGDVVTTGAGNRRSPLLYSVPGTQSLGAVREPNHGK